MLSLAGLPIEDQHLAQLAKLKQLQSLDLTNTKITDVGLPSLSGLTELIGLALTSTTVTTVGLQSLKPLPNLEVLDLLNTSADDRTAELLCDFPHLRKLRLGNTRLTEAGVRRLALRPLPWYWLRLANLPTVTDAILTDLRAQRELFFLDLGQTSVTDAAFEAFVREHPRLGMTLATDDSEAPDLRVARRVLAAGGEVVLLTAPSQPSLPLVVSVEPQAPRVRRIEDLPKEPFRILDIDLRLAGAKATDEALAEVGRLEMLGYFHAADAVISDGTVTEITAPKLVSLHFAGTPLSSSAVRQIVLVARETERCRSGDRESVEVGGVDGVCEVGFLRHGQKV